MERQAQGIYIDEAFSNADHRGNRLPRVLSRYHLNEYSKPTWSMPVKPKALALHHYLHASTGLLYGKDARNSSGAAKGALAWINLLNEQICGSSRLC